LNKRLAKLEQVIPSKAQAEAHSAAWQEVLKEFDLLPDTPLPNHRPIVRQLIEADGTPFQELLRMNGRYVCHT